MYVCIQTSTRLIQAGQAQATSYTDSPSTGNQLYRQPKHRQPVIQAATPLPKLAKTAEAQQITQATSYIGSKPKHRQPVIQASQAQATSYTGSTKHRQPVTQAAQAQATSYTSKPKHMCACISICVYIYVCVQTSAPFIQAGLCNWLPVLGQPV